MPELPDLEVFSKNLDKAFAGKKLEHINVKEDKKLNVSASDLQKHLQNKTIKKIYRDGKELYFKFSNDDILSLHLMLKGQLFIFKEKNDHKHTIIEMIFDDGTGLCLIDYQKQATPQLNPEEPTAPDALSKAVTVDFFKKNLDTKTAIKKLLMDQHVIRGIGNAYADEILWHAGISPLSKSNKIPEAKIKALAKAIPQVLKDAEKQIIKANPDIISGEVRDFLDIHNSKKSHSPNGSPIIVTTVGSRKTYYTKEQELFE